MKTHTSVDTTLFTMIIATLITGVCLSSAGSFLTSHTASADTVAVKAVASKQL